MRTLITAFVGGMAASVPAIALFNDVGVSPYRNFDKLLPMASNSIEGLLLFYSLILFLPALGSAIGAKIGGRWAEFHYIYGRGIGGQLFGAIVFGVLMTVIPDLGAAVEGMDTPTQTVVALMAAQVGCTLGTVWGL